MGLFVINFFTVQTISSSQDYLWKIKDYQQQLQDFANTIKIAEIQTNQVKRILTGTGSSLQKIDNETIQNVTTNIQSGLAEITPAIHQLSTTTEIAEFQNLADKTINAYKNWGKKKDLTVLESALNSIKNVEFMADTMISTLTQRFDNEIAFIQKQMNYIIIADIVANILILAILTLLIFPLLTEFKMVLTPLRQASDISLEGAANVLSHASDIDISFKQFKTVLNIMGISIAEVYQGAQYSSLQAKSIIISVKTASDLVTDLAEKASTIFLSLSSNQQNFEGKIQQIEYVTERIGRSLRIIMQNIVLAEKLITKITPLQNRQEPLPANVSSANSIQEMADIANHMAQDLNTAYEEFKNLNLEFIELKLVLESLFSSNRDTIFATENQIKGTEQIQLKTQQIMRSIENIIAQTEEVSASMQELAASSEEINSQMEFINNQVVETHEVVEKQFDLAKLAKETTDRF